MTSIELAKELHLGHKHLRKLLLDSISRHNGEAGNPPLTVEAYAHEYNSGIKPTTIYELTPDVMRALYAYPPVRGAVWPRLYEVHPEWRPANHEAIDGARRDRKAAQRRTSYKQTREKMKEERDAIRDTMSQAELIQARLYTHRRAADVLGLPSADVLTARLSERGIIRRGRFTWELTEAYAERGLAKTVSILVGCRYDAPTPYPTLAWTERGMRYLHSLSLDTNHSQSKEYQK